MRSEAQRLAELAATIKDEATRLRETIVQADEWTGKARKRQRRRSAVLIGISVVSAIWLHDEHVEHCGPAHRPTSRTEQIICDVTFPFHSHPLAPTTTSRP